MSKSRIINVFSNISISEKIGLIAKLSWNLTIEARSHYANFSDSDIKRLILINESQHRISRLIIEISSKNERFTDEYISEYIEAILENFHVDYLFDDLFNK